MPEAKKSRFSVYLVSALVIFLAGIVAGYALWGKADSSPDYKKTLNDVITYIATIEHKNRKLSEQIGTLEDQVEQLEAAQSAPAASSGDGQLAQLQGQLGALQQENAALKASMSQNQAFARENQELKARNQALQEKIDSLRASLMPEAGTEAPPAEMPAE